MFLYIHRNKIYYAQTYQHKIDNVIDQQTYSSNDPVLNLYRRQRKLSNDITTDHNNIVIGNQNKLNLNYKDKKIVRQNIQTIKE